MRAFNADECRAVHELVRPAQYQRLSALSLAIVAYCEPDFSTAEQFFSLAETLDPSSDNVAVLHARFLSNQGLEDADRMWEKVALLARNRDYLYEAREQLEANVTEPTHTGISRTWSSYALANLGAGVETKPDVADTLLGQPSNPSAFNSVVLNAGMQRNFSFGFLGVNDQLTWHDYFSSSASNLLGNNLDFPFSIRAGTYEDLRIRPFGSFQQLGDSAYYNSYGVAMQGVVYRGTYKQICQGEVFHDGYYPQSLKAQGGTHFRFDYTWASLGMPWLHRILIYLEHVQAGRDVVRQGSAVVVSIPYSHTDVAVDLYSEYSHKWIIFGLGTKLLLREDDNNSTFPDPTTTSGQNSKQRQDFQLSLSPSITVPITYATQLRASYQFIQRFSNMNAGDYVDWTFEDQVWMLTLQVALDML